MVLIAKESEPHTFSNVEWWYFYAFLNGDKGGKYAVIASFFRVGEIPLNKGHYLIYSLIDLADKCRKNYSLVDRKMLFSLVSIYLPYYLLHHPNDAQMRKLYINLLKLNLPSPHKSMQHAFITKNPTCLVYGENSVTFYERGNEFALNLVNGDLVIELQAAPMKPLSLVGGNGKPENDLYYDSYTNNKVWGQITSKEKTEYVEGTGWYDHQWGNTHELILKLGWNWFGLQLEDGRELLVNQFRSIRDEKTISSIANIIDKQGNLKCTTNVILRPTNKWVSQLTNAAYPMEWTILIPEYYIKINILADFPEQEMPVLGPLQAIWEGTCSVLVEERLPLQKVTTTPGKGFMELVGYAHTD